MLARWEAVAQTAQVEVIGPPNWLVQEGTRSGEDHMMAFTRIWNEYRDAYRRGVTKSVTEREVLPNIVTKSAGRKPFGNAPLTAAEKQRAYRDRRNGNR